MSTPDIAKGQEVYAQACQACHQPTGLGLSNVFPPLDGSDWVTGPAGVPVAIILKGLKGPIEVNGTAYNSAMPAANYLTNEQIANVTTYIRQAWSNSAEPVNAATVTQVQEMIAEQTTPWTAEQLQTLIAENSSSSATPAIASSNAATTIIDAGSFDIAKITEKPDNHWYSFSWIMGALVFMIAIIAGLKKLTH